MEEVLYSVVTRKGQITLPATIRAHLAIKVGDRVALSLRPDSEDEVIIRPARSVAESTFGVVKPRRQPEDYDELRQLFEASMAEEETSSTETTL
ncbi:MAG: AbrB/MazE/SpoVT family DNA-binding domain-containing protein [Anaerolineae bacterium]